VGPGPACTSPVRASLGHHEAMISLATIVTLRFARPSPRRQSMRWAPRRRPWPTGPTTIAW